MLSLLCGFLFLAGPALANPPQAAKKSKGSAAADLPKMKGSSVPKARKTLKKNGFTQTKVSNSAAKNETWKHADGSEVRLHPRGNEQTAPYKSANNAHIHKEDPSGKQLDDHGHASSDPKKTHIGAKNPKDLPAVRNRPHGAGTQ